MQRKLPRPHRCAGFCNEEAHGVGDDIRPVAPSPNPENITTEPHVGAGLVENADIIQEQATVSTSQA